MDLSLILVAYRSSGVLGAAADSFRAEAEELGLATEVLVVDQSEEEAEAARLRDLRPDQLIVQPNRGYAAGINRGVAAARGPVLLLGNPDIVFTPGSLQAILATLDAGWEIVGPQFVLGEFLFPPAESQTPWGEMGRWLASRSLQAWKSLFRREVRRWLRVWEASSPVAVSALSGALLAVRAETAARVGPWDEDYFLYFEETDWLRRARRLGCRLALAPRVRIIHRWGHAADPEAWASVYDRARRRYFARHFGFVGRLASRLQVRGSPLHPRPWTREAAASVRRDTLWLVSPLALGLPAAGAFLSPEAVQSALEEFSRQCPTPRALTILAWDPEAARVRSVWAWAPPGFREPSGVGAPG